MPAIHAVADGRPPELTLAATPTAPSPDQPPPGGLKRLAALPDRLERGRAVIPAEHLGVAVGVEVLVDVEEVADLGTQLDREVVDVLEEVPPRVVDRHAHDVVVGALLVGHLEQPNDLCGHDAARERRLGDTHEHVERVAVGCERSGHVAVIRRGTRPTPRQTGQA